MGKTLNLFVILLLAGLQVGCTNQSVNKAKIRKALKELNDQCPMVLNRLVSITSIELDEDTVVYKSLYNEEILSVAELGKDKNARKENVIMTFVQGAEKTKEDMRTFSDNGLWIKYVYRGQQSGEMLDLLFSPEDIRNALDFPLTPEEVNERIIKNEVAASRKNLPEELDEGMVFTTAEVEPDKVVYCYEMDEDLYDIYAIKANEEALKQEMEQIVSVMEPFLKAMVFTQRKVEYRYIGKQSQRSISIFFDVDELKSLIKDDNSTLQSL